MLDSSASGGSFSLLNLLIEFKISILSQVPHESFCFQIRSLLHFGPPMSYRRFLPSLVAKHDELMNYQEAAEDNCQQSDDEGKSHPGVGHCLLKLPGSAHWLARPSGRPN